MRWCVWIVCSMLLFGCGSKKQLERIELNDDWYFRSELRNELNKQLQVLEHLDIDYRREEKRDSCGGVTVVSQVRLSRERQENGEQKQTQVKVDTGVVTKVVNAEKRVEVQKRGRWLWWCGIGILLGVGAFIWWYKKR